MGVGIIEHFPLRAYEGNGARAGRLSRTRSAYVHAFGSEPPAECWRDQEYKREAQRPSGASTPSASASACEGWITHSWDCTTWLAVQLCMSSRFG